MNAELKAKWIEALRSGKYKQGRTQLRSDNDAFCCLGVLCDIEPDVTWEKKTGSYDAVYDSEFDGGELPSSFREWAGISSDREQELIEMNDDYGKSFAEIADYIEKNL